MTNIFIMLPNFPSTSMMALPLSSRPAFPRHICSFTYPGEAKLAEKVQRLELRLQ